MVDVPKLNRSAGCVKGFGAWDGGEYEDGFAEEKEVIFKF